MKHPRPLGYHQKTKPLNHGYKRRKKKMNQRHRKYIQQNNSRKIPHSQERESYLGTGDFQNTKQARSEKKYP
jgi:hypothetical protein